jgi:hypothetical protein
MEIERLTISGAGFFFVVGLEFARSMMPPAPPAPPVVLHPAQQWPVLAALSRIAQRMATVESLIGAAPYGCTQYYPYGGRSPIEIGERLRVLYSRSTTKTANSGAVGRV